MITLTLAVPENDALMAAGFDSLVVSKSVTGTFAGPYVPSGAAIPLVAATTGYTFIDPAGIQGDWYTTQYSAAGSLSSISPPQPAYLGDLLNQVRAVMGVTIVEADDATILSTPYLPAALAHARNRLPTFDSIVWAGGDLAQFALAALAHYTAAMLCPRMTLTIMDAEQFRDYRYQRNRQLDWAAIGATFMEQYEDYISHAANEVAADPRMYVPGMLLAGPTSSGNDTELLTPFAPDFENPLVPYSTNPPRGD